MPADDGFGPALRGGPAGARPGSATGGDVPRAGARPGGAGRPDEGPAGPPPDADDGFGPALRGRADRRTRDPRSPRGARSAPATRPDGRGGVPPAGPATDRPVPQRRRPRRRRAWLLLTVPLLLVTLAVAGAVAVALHASGQVERVSVDGLADAEAMNILVVGSDSRDGLSEQEMRDLGTGSVAGKRTDTIFVLSTRGGESAILSFPRDLYVTRCDGSQGRINAAFVIGGPSCLVETVSAVSGIPITHYLEMSFLSFVRIVDAVGGVEVCVEEAIRDVSAAIDLPAGCSHLDGATALGFVRVRKIDDDLGRIARQQYFLQQLASEVAQPSTLLNVPRLWSTAGAAGGALITDEDFGPVDLARLGLAARGLAAGGTRTHVVPTTPQTIGGAAVLVQRDAEAAALYASFRDSSVLAAPTAGPTPTDAAAP